MRIASLIVSFMLIVPAFAVDPKDLKRGLIATYASGQSSRQQFESTVALNGRQSGEVKWSGYLYVVTPGDYAFSAHLAGGKAQVTVDKQNVYIAENANQTAKLIAGKPVTLVAGPQPLEVRFESTEAGIARLELLWDGPGFRHEPIPYFFVSHLAADRNAAFLADREREHGRFLFEEHGCKNCHAPDGTAAFVERKGASLVDAGTRIFPGWLDAWLADPTKLRPHTTMPKLFADDERGKAERYAVVQYLASFGNALLPQPAGRDDGQSVRRGERLFLQTGCATCHANKPNDSIRKRTDDDDPLPPYDPTSSLLGLGTATGPQGTYSLGVLGSKTTPSRLSEYLHNPHKNHPTTRMPNMMLDGRDARDLANYLCRTKDNSISLDVALPPLKPGDLPWKSDVPNFESLVPEKQWQALGEVIAVRKGCANCHELPKTKLATPAFASLDNVAKKPDGLCVSPKPNPSKAPAYLFDESQRKALVSFLTHLASWKTVSKTYEARVALKRLMCLNCHTRDGEGGIAADLADKMKALESAENADDVRPPSLTHIGHKATHEWLKDVLLNKGRARPWMGLRMPQYGEAHVDHLVDALPRLEGTTIDEKAVPVPIDAALVTAGRTLTGKDGYGCIACHDISGVVGGGTRGPDLALTTKRIRPEWFERWMHNPQRMSPGTKMPQYFLDGKATNALLDADPAKQIDAFRAYFSLGMGLPLPNGLEPPKGVVLVVKDRPELLRTFMPDGAGTRSFAVGYPGHVNIAYDSTQARIAYAWAGNFLDASPVWTNRGGNAAKLLGPKFWTAPPGHPWTVGNNVPDVAERAADPAFGGINDPNKAFTGTPLLTYDGYSIDSKGFPTFRSTVRESENRTGPALTVFEKPMPLTSNVATGFARRFTFETVEPHMAWYLISDDADSVKICGPDGQLIMGQPKEKLNVTEYRFAFPQANGGAVVFIFPKLPKDSTFALIQSQKKNGKTPMFLRIPKVGKDAEVVIHTWVVAKDDAKLIRELK
jgi:cytochrome c551/c552